MDRLEDMIEDIREAVMDQNGRIPYDVRVWLDKFNRVGASVQSQLRELIS